MTERSRVALFCFVALLTWLGTKPAFCASPPFTVSGVNGAVSVEYAAGAPEAIKTTKAEPKPIPTAPRPADAQVVGDNVGDPFVISAIPFSATGSTVGFTDDYFEACPYLQVGAPDVVYSFTPSSNMIVSIELCGSAYDTKVYVYAGAVTAGSPYACNDDYCGTNYVNSVITSLPLNAGTQYFIIVDGYSNFSGSYTLEILPDGSCVWTGCGEGAQAENEVCANGTDVTNGGCGTAAHNFTALPFEQLICGQVWAELPNRDTDWYRTTLTGGVTVRWSVHAEFPVSLFVFDLTAGCDSLKGGVRIDGNRCDDLTLEITPGATADFALVVTTLEQFGGYTCAQGPWEYEMVLENACACECHGDPAQTPSSGECDGVININDIVTAVNLAFRGANPIPDPLATCPYERADVDCNGAVAVGDVVRLVNVAFRGQSVETQFVNPCSVP